MCATHTYKMHLISTTLAQAMTLPGTLSPARLLKSHGLAASLLWLNGSQTQS